MSDMITQGIGSAAQLVGQFFQHRHEKKLNERTIEAQQNASQFEWDKNLEQWNRANQYNAPTQQMSRLREAGLNPAMIYGSGGAKTTAAVSPKYQAPRPTYSYSAPADPTAMLGAYNDFRMKNAQVDLLRSQAETQRAIADNAPVLQKSRGMHAFYNMGMAKTNYNWAKKINEKGVSNQWEKLGYDLDAMRLKNSMAGEMITGQNLRNSILDKDLETYMWRNLGAGSIQMLMKLFKRGGKAGAKGIQNKFPVKDQFNQSPLQKWKKNKIFENYRSTAFD